MCGTARWWAKLALVCILVAVPLHIGGWASNNWMTYESSLAQRELDIGLWEQKNCTLGVCDKSTVEDTFVTDEFDAVRGLETVVMLLVIVLSVLFIIYVCIRGTRVVNFAIFIVVLCFLAGLLSLVGTFIWLASVPTPFVSSYSMGLTVLALLLIFLAGSLMVPEILDAFDDDPYRAPRAVSPLYSSRHTVVTPISQRGGITPISYRNGMYSDGFRY